MNGTRMRKMTQDVFIRVKGLWEKYPEATGDEIGRMIFSGGGLSGSTALKVRRCATWDDYLAETKKTYERWIASKKQQQVTFVPEEPTAPVNQFDRLADLLEQVAVELRKLRTTHDE